MHFMDENFWIAISFLVFLYFAYRPIKRAITNSLDSKINEIKDRLAQSDKIKDEAKTLLAEVQREIDNFQVYKKQILDNAKSGTEKLVENRTKEIDLILSRKEESAKMLIENEATKAANKLRDEFTNNVIKLVRSYLAKTNNNNTTDLEILNNFIKKD